jgi:hypothetical protein
MILILLHGKGANCVHLHFSPTVWQTFARARAIRHTSFFTYHTIVIMITASDDVLMLHSLTWLDLINPLAGNIHIHVLHFLSGWERVVFFRLHICTYQKSVFCIFTLWYYRIDSIINLDFYPCLFTLCSWRSLRSRCEWKGKVGHALVLEAQLVEYRAEQQHPWINFTCYDSSSKVFELVLA